MDRDQKLACLTMDVESDLRSPVPHIELFSNPAYFIPFTELVADQEIPITAFLVTRLVEELPSELEKAACRLKIDFEVHSYSHSQEEADSEREIERSVESYRAFFGKDPKGYRAPNGLISADGLSRLSQFGFRYDSSIFPAIRMDEYGYNNLSLPTDPFVFLTPDPMIEVPVGVVSRIRLVVSISYIKLLGFRTFELLLKLFGAPDALVILCHPYDFTIRHSLPHVRGWKKWAHARNASNSLQILSRLIELLKQRGYQFVSMDELVERLRPEDLRKIDSSSLSS